MNVVIFVFQLPTEMLQKRKDDFIMKTRNCRNLSNDLGLHTL